MISVHDVGQQQALGDLNRFRQAFYDCLTTRTDGLFELADAVLCTDGPVRTLVGLSLAPEHRRGHGGLYDAINNGRIEINRLRTALATLPLPRATDGRLVLAVDVSPWLRPDANTCPDRSFCHTYGRGKNEHRMIPGWPYSIVAALETGRTSWTALLDAIRLLPGADLAAVTTSQIRDVVHRLIAAGQWHDDDPEILVVLDAGYDAPRVSPTCWATSPSRSWAGCGRTGCYVGRPHPACTTPTAASQPSTGPSSSSAPRTPGAPRTRRPAPTPGCTATPQPSRGTGRIPG